MGELVAAVRRTLREHADADLAPGQQAYMKSSMPFLGVRVPMVRKLTRAAARATPPADLADLERSARELWDEATHREERYAATELTALRLATGCLELLPLHEHVAVTGAWWDHVDEVAHHIADLHDAHPDETAAAVRRWSTSDDRWLRRLAIISQLGRRERVDRQLLATVIEPHVADPEFFVRKAIGWALRDVARTDPEWVRSFVDTHELSPLSRREALKHL
ncbi:DNA alkylation repair protein [Aeromicrobium sp.]|uniref:DNA alkylation repair protein n=1 Tax=Aeromicrobium sp. TaxID=1871063 RepID=UPI003C555167